MFTTSKYYNSIDNCPILIFHKCLQGDISKLCYKGKSHINSLNQSWQNIFNEYIKEFGLNPAYTRYLQKMQKACEYYEMAYVHGQKDQKTMAQITEREALIEMGEQGSDNFNKVVAWVSKEMGFPVNPQKISVREFYSYVDLANGK